MTKWQLVEIEEAYPSNITSTSPETIEWLIGEMEKRSPEIELTRLYDAEDLLYSVHGKRINAELRAVVKRLLCENGWEPSAIGTDERYLYWQFKRQTKPPVERYRW